MKITVAETTTSWPHITRKKQGRTYALETDSEFHRIQWGGPRNSDTKRPIQYNVPMVGTVYMASFEREGSHGDICTRFNIYLKPNELTLQEAMNQKKIMIPPLPNISSSGEVCFDLNEYGSLWDNIMKFRSQGDNRDYFFDTVRNPMWIELAAKANTRKDAMRKIFSYWETLSFDEFEKFKTSALNKHSLNQLYDISSSYILGTISTKNNVENQYIKTEVEVTRQAEEIDFEDLVKI